MKPHFIFSDRGSLTTVTALSGAPYDHLLNNTDGNAAWLNGVLVVENRFAPDLSAQLCRDGFAVELPDGRIVTADDLATA